MEFIIRAIPPGPGDLMVIIPPGPEFMGPLLIGPLGEGAIGGPTEPGPPGPTLPGPVIPPMEPPNCDIGDGADIADGDLPLAEVLPSIPWPPIGPEFP